MDLEETNSTLSNTNITCGEETLYHLLFSNEFNQQHQNLDDSYLYLQDLNSFHVDRLQSEPIYLHDKKQQIQDEIKNLAFSNYKTFIRTAQCSKEIYSDFSIIETKLDSLINKLPDFGSLCDNFTKIIQTMNTHRRTNNLTLQKHNQLLEILEISQLMDTCVRNEYYEEALDLASYVKRLDKKFSSTIPLIKQIVADVNQSLNLMLKQLLQQLRTNLQFNQCLKIIGIIRRLDVFTESELRVKFLQLRDIWLQSLLNAIPTNDSYQHITKTIEEYRIHLFDIITQYRAIFSSSDDTNSSNETFKITDQSNNDTRLFYTWLQQKIKMFLFILSKDLKLGVGNRLDSVLSQSMYFGLAFSRVGLDFRVLMVPLFEEAILEQIKKQINEANLKFEDSMSKLNWSELYSENQSQSQQQQQQIDMINKTSLINPPITLLDYTPLAVYLNCLLGCFNELRLCAPLSLFTQVTILIRESLKQMSSFLNVYFRKEKQTFDSNELNLFKDLIQQLAFKLIPFLEQCLFVLFPMDQLEKVLNIQQNDLIKLKQCFSLNIDIVLVDIKDLILQPKVIEESKEEVIIENNNNEVIEEAVEDKTNDLIVENDNNLPENELNQ